MTHTVTNIGKLITRSESILLANLLTDEFPDDAPDITKKKLIEVLKFIQQRRMKNKADGRRVNMLLRGKFPEFREKKHFLNAPDYIADWDNF
mgnify:CR=1 FL=1